MKTIFKLACLLFSLFGFTKMIQAKNNQFVIAKEFANVTYKIEKGSKKYQLYFHAIEDIKTKEFLYCIEPGVALDEGFYDEIFDFTKVNLTKEQMDQVALISYFGYRYKGHDSLNYYLAAQKLIWDIVIPKTWSIYFTNKLGGERIELAQIEQQEILELVKKYQTVPDFGATHFIKNSRENFILKDQNQILEDYEIQSNLNIEKHSNELIVKSNSKGTETITFKKKQPHIPYQVFYSAKGQNLIRKGLPEPPTKSITVETYENQIIITKVGKGEEENQPLKNVLFGLYAEEDIFDHQTRIYEKDELIIQARTDDNGILVFNHLYDGRYKIKELATNEGFLLDESIYKVELSNTQQTVHLNLENELERHQIILKKVDTSKNPISQVTFELYDMQHNLIKRLTTNELGIITFDGLIPGTYYLKEVACPREYVIDTNERMIVLEKEDITLEITNHTILVPNTLEKETNFLAFASLLSVTYLYEKRKKLCF